jgi:hypothetical protein
MVGSRTRISRSLPRYNRPHRQTAGASEPWSPSERHARAKTEQEGANHRQLRRNNNGPPLTNKR